ncbi:Fungalysin metallopeptidase-domain-containing protein, partial [Cladochytrium replicatum]
SHKSSVGVTHVYVAQAINGVRIANAVANFNVGRRGEIISMYHNFVQNDRNRRLQRPTVGVEEAIISFATAAGLPADDTLTVASNGKGGFVVTGATFTIWPIQVRETFYQSELGLLRTWELGVTMPDLCQNVYVDSTSGKVVGVATLTSDFTESYENIAVQAREKRSRRDILPATYSVIPLGRSDPMDNNGFLSRVASPWDLRASPQGWHFENGSQTFEVRGNNVIAQANPNDLDPTKVAGLPRPNSTTLDFEYTYDASKEPADPQNQAASVVNMFYAANIMHDLFYVYGFDEAAGNFQTSNFGKGGLENDAIIANVQDELASNNANFAPSVDGVPGIMRMGIFTSSTPSRDSGFANGIIAHEMAHGLSSRLTGGSGNPNCVQSIESWGMDEGWADAFELFVTLRDEEGRGDSFPSGEWAFNLPNGVREVPVSSNTTVNKLTYANARSRRQLYRIGNVWTTMINEVLWNMVDISGRTPTSHIISSSDASTGNTDLIKIIVLAMKMQPCQPLMIQAKQAMLDAEKLLFDGTYACAIHAGFAKRGLGAKATQEKVNDFSMPVECD